MPSKSKRNSQSTQVDAFFSGFIKEDTPGAAVIVLRNGKVLHHAAYGLADLEKRAPLTTDHIFHLASVGKQMTALALMMLAEKGKLIYDDAAGKYVPEIRHFGEGFTIRRLLHHTSGLPDYESGIAEALRRRSEFPTNEDLLAHLADMDGPPRAPGEAFEYSNPGYELLAVVIERASGEKFPGFMRSHIFEPVGMTRTFSLPDEARRADPLMAMSYTQQNGQPAAYPNDPLDNLYGSGSICSTTTDMALYDEALYKNKFVSPSTLKEALQPVVLNNGSIEPYGFGWELDERNGEPYMAHSGSWLGFKLDYARFPKQHFSNLVLLNRDYGIPDEPRIALKVADFFLE